MTRLMTGVLLALAMTVLVVPVSQAATYKIATISPDGLGWMQQLRQTVKEIEEATDGRVKFKIYPGGVQGDDFTVLRKMRIGQLHGGAVAAGSLTRFYPDLQVYNLPLQFKTFEEVDHVRKQMDQQIIDGLDEGGMVVFSMMETGFAYLLTKTPVTSVGDLAELKAWVPEGDPISEALIKTFDVAPIPLNITDVLAGLQTGLINAVAVPPLVAIALQWHNHVEYMMDVPLVYIYGVMAIDKKAWRRISDDDQVVVRERLNALFESIDRVNRTDNQNAYKALIAQGIKTTTPTEEELIEWQEVSNRSVGNLVETGEITAEILMRYQALLDEFRSQSGAGETGR